MLRQDRSIRNTPQAPNTVPDNYRFALVPAHVRHADYGFDLSSYFGDETAELVNVRVQGKG